MSPETTLAEILAAIDKAEAGEARVVVPFKTAGMMLGKSYTSVTDLARAGAIKTLIDGNRRLVLTSSIYSHLRACAHASYSPAGEPVKVRIPRSVFKHKHRVPTQNELDALARANTARRLAAEARRAARKDAHPKIEVRQPATRLRRRPRQPTEPELAGLRLANERRKRVAEARRAKARGTKSPSQEEV
jgi:primosomal protein N'